MSTVDCSERDAEGKIIGPPRRQVMIVDSGIGAASFLAMASALAGSGIACINTFEREQRGREMKYTPCKEHERHQGEKERQRRLKRLAAEAVQP